MLSKVFPYFLVGLVAWTIARAARQRQASNVALVAAALMALFGQLSHRSVPYLFALLLLGLSFYLLGRERSQRQLSAALGEDEESDDQEKVVGRLPGETIPDMIERHVLGIRTAPNAAPMRSRARAAYRVLQRLSVEELRPVFELVKDPNAAVRSLALPLLIEKGDEAALELLREARSQHRDMETGYVLAVCHRGGLELEPELTHAERGRRREALLLLVRTVTGRIYPELGPDRPEIKRLVTALQAESDTELLLELSGKLAEHSQLRLLSDHWSRFSLPGRRALLRLAKLGPERVQLEDLVALFQCALTDAEPLLGRAAVRVLRQPGAEALRAELGDPALPLRGWLELTLPTSGATVPCQDGGTLQVAAGALRVRLRFRPLGGTSPAAARVLLELCDSEGRAWRLRSYVGGSAFSAGLQEQRTTGVDTGLVRESLAPAAWREALQERCVLARLSEHWQGDGQLELQLAGRRHAVTREHQHPSIDVALLGEQLLVRASGLRESTFKGLGPLRVFAGSAPLPSLLWLAPAQLLLCFNAPQRHYARRRDLDDLEDPAQGRPSRARRLERQGEAQPAVVYTPAAPASAALVSPAPAAT